MKFPNFFIVAFVSGLVAAISTTPAAIIVTADSITVQNVEVGQIGVSAFIEVRVEHDLQDADLSGFQLQLKLPQGQTDAVFNSVANTTLHPALLPATAFITRIESTTLLAAKFNLNPEEMPSESGLARVRVDIAPGFVGVVPLTIVSITDDPDFGTLLSDAQFSPLETGVAGASINVVIPEPAGALLVAMSILLGRQRFRVSA